MNFSEGDFELKEIQRLEGHTGKVLGIAWKQDTGIWGRPLAIASWSDDKTVRIWEENFSGILECKAVLEESHGRSVRSCAWSPPCKLLAVAFSDATTAIWKNVGNAYERVYTLEGHDNEVRSVSWNTKGDLLATCGGDKSVWIWEVLPGNEFDCASVLHGHTKDVKMVQWHEDMLFSCSYDNTIKVWEEICGGGDWACIQTLGESDSGHTSTISCLSVNNDYQMVSCRYGFENDYVGSKLIWTHACTLSGYHDRTVFSVDWLREMIRCLPEGQEDPGIFASAGADNAIRLFIENKDNEVDGLTFKLLLKKEKAHEMNISSVKWKAGDRRLLASASDDGTVKIWELVCPCPAGAS
ncbi:protein CIA1-like [Lycium barbarum]|uniref:protein CIA1-like n=2 Tax=Lycium barbarum TaxID=112863 RepID=UPI00293F3E5F|nr:protein CIA1-like [Lycium barbarum]